MRILLQFIEESYFELVPDVQQLHHEEEHTLSIAEIGGLIISYLMSGFVQEFLVRFHSSSFRVVVALGELVKSILQPANAILIFSHDMKI